MSNIKNFLLDTAYLYQKYHPYYSLDESIHYIQNNRDLNFWMNYEEYLQNIFKSYLRINFSLNSVDEVNDHLTIVRKIIDRYSNVKRYFEEDDIFLTVSDLEITLYARKIL